MPDFISPKDLAKLNKTIDKRMGFRSRVAEAKTNAERQRLWRNGASGRAVLAKFNHVGAASLVYIKNQWGFKTNVEAVQTAVRYLAVQTRKGLERIDLEID
jgi:hypothetical protein